MQTRFPFISVIRTHYGFGRSCPAAEVSADPADFRDAVGADIVEMSTGDGLGGKRTLVIDHTDKAAQIVSSLTSAQHRLKLF
jgi:hypothetical protein